MSNPLKKQHRFRIDRLEERLTTSVPEANLATIGMALAAGGAGAALVYRVLPGDDDAPRSARAFWRSWRPAFEGLEERLTPAPVIALQPIPQVVHAATATNFNLGTIADTAFAKGFVYVNINWGDGTNDATPNGGGTATLTGTSPYKLSDSHTYATDGAYTVTVTAFDPATNFAMAPAPSQTTTIVVANASITGTTLTVNESPSPQISFQTVATLNNPGSPLLGGGYTATINWGDGTPGNPDITPADTVFGITAGGPYAVVGTHNYAADGTYTLTVTAFEGGVQIATGTSTALIAEDDLAASFGAGVLPATIAEGQAFQGILASATDGGQAPTNGTATINWGDGTTTTASIGELFSAALSGAQQVPPTPTPASGTATIELTPDQSTITTFTSYTGLATPPTGAHLHIAPAGQNAQTGIPVDGNGNPTTGVSGIALDSNGNPIEFTPLPATTTGTLGPQTFTVNGGPGQFVSLLQKGDVYENIHDAAFPSGEIRGQFELTGDTIGGAHTYADEGIYTITVTFTENDANGKPVPNGTIAISQTITVTDADTLAPAAGVTQPSIGTTTQPLAVGTTFSGPVGIFSDLGYPGQSRNDLTATINWGDGTSGSGTITKDPTTNLFTVSGKHTFGGPGTFPVSVTLQDDPEPGITLNPPGVVHTTAVVGNTAATLAATPILTVEGAQFSGVLATLTDPNSINAATGQPNPPSAYVVSVSWGDGDSNITTDGSGTVTITGPNGGPYVINAQHFYTVDGNYTVTISVTEPGVLPVPLVTTTTTATVADAEITVNANPVAAKEGTAFTGAVGTFTDPGAVQVIPTVPGNGDVNPYGVAIVPANFPLGGVLQPGDILVSNFNNVGNVQGTGTTITLITPDGNTSTFFTSTPQGLSTGLVVLSSGFVIVGNVPNTGGAFPSNIGTGTLQVLNANGQLVETINDPNVTDPWDLAVNDQGTTAQLFVSNVAANAGVSTPTGNVIRINLSIPAGGMPTEVGNSLQIGGAYPTRSDMNAFVVGPGGLAYNAATDTLYVASTDDAINGVEAGTIFAIAHAGTTAVTGTTEGTVVFADPTHLHGPIGLVLAPNGDLITANSDAVNADPNQPSELVEFTTAGQFVGQFSIDPNNGGAFGLAIGTIGGLTKFAAVDDNQSTLTVFNFLPTQPTAGSAFTATINWGDGTAANPDLSAGTITYGGSGLISGAFDPATGDAATFTITGTHTYADEGSYPVNVTVTENGLAQSFFTLLNGANQVPAVATGGSGFGQLILSANQTTLTFSSIFQNLSGTATEAHLHVAPAGQSPAVPPGLATDANGNPIAFTNVPSATSGTLGPQTFTVNASFVNELLGGNIYENIHSTADPEGEIRGQFVQGASTATVADADVFSGLAITSNLTAKEGVATPQVVATFTNTGYPGQSASDLTATINWGDGSAPTTGTIAATGNGGFTVTAGHAYAAPGTNIIAVTINDDAPGTATATASGTISVTSVALTAVGLPILGTESLVFSGPVASFTTPNLLATASQFTATVLWGDLNQSPPPPVTITGGNGSFTVSSSHIYLTEGTFTTTVIISENAPGTATATVNGTATIADIDKFVVTVTPPASIVAGTPLTNVQVATFTDLPYPSNPITDMLATIAWGDGTTSTGTIVNQGGGNFQVFGSHTYTQAGALALSVTIKDIDGTASGTGSAPITVKGVTPTDVLTASAVNSTPPEGAAAIILSVATFTDTNTATLAGAFTASVAWSDGVTTAGTVSGSVTRSGYFSVSTSRAFTSEANLTAKTTITGPGGPVTATSTITVTDSDVFVVTVTPPAGAQPGVALTSIKVATFTDTGYPTNSTADMAATINWGDGTAATTGTVTGSNGNFAVTGSHTYAKAGSYSLTVTIKDVDGTATASNTATVAVAAPVVSPKQNLQAGYNIVVAQLNTQIGANTAVKPAVQPAATVSLTKNDLQRLNAAIADLTNALNPALYIDGSHLQPHGGIQVFTDTSNAVGELGEIYTDPSSALSKPTILSAINLILAADQQFAQIAINEATAAGGTASVLKQAASEMNAAAVDLAQSRTDWDGAAEHYGNAWTDALHSVGKI